ncbi:MAG: hypothetical protein GY847_11595 [Proteobacteria bacterium]|nr:hypothetical protein [Pseudomonadota bacterium]
MDLLFVSNQTFADEADPTEYIPKITMIALREQNDDFQAVIEILEAQLSDLDVEFNIEWIEAFTGGLRTQAEVAKDLGEKTGARVVFWADLSVDDQIFLYFAEPGGKRILVRTIEFEQDQQDGRLEVMAVIVRTVIEAIAKDGEIGVTSPVEKQEPKPTLPPDPVPEPPPKQTLPDSKHQFGLSAAYGLTMYDLSPFFIHGARLATGLCIAGWADLFVAYRFQIPFEAENDLIAMELRPHPFEVGFAGRIKFKNFYVDIGAAILNDLLSWSVRSKIGDKIEPMEGTFRWLVAASPFAKLSWSPSNTYKLYFSIGADAYFNETPSTVKRTNGDKETVVDPMHVKLYLQIGAMFFYPPDMRQRMH